MFHLSLAQGRPHSAYSKTTSALLLALLLLRSPLYAADRIPAKIVDRKESTSQYTYTVPAYSKTKSTANANCFGTENTANCSGTGQSTTTTTPGTVNTYEVQGATFSLQLSDGRIAVVNCDRKQVYGNEYRSCRMPIVDTIDAEFKGDKAKLFWPVSIDGKKWESETYKILGIIERP